MILMGQPFDFWGGSFKTSLNICLVKTSQVCESRPNIKNDAIYPIMILISFYLKILCEVKINIQVIGQRREASFVQHNIR